MTKNYKQSVVDFPTKKHRKINPSSSTTISSSQEVVVVIVHLVDFHLGSKLLTNFYRSIPKFILNSKIIINNNIYLSNELIFHTKHDSYLIPSPKLLYRGSRDGFKAIDFHSRCDHQGPIIKSEFNQIFGGFTTQSWKSSKLGEFISDSSAFIFKIDDENSNQLFRKFNIKQEEKKYAFCTNANYLTLFGGGSDICILNECNIHNHSFSNFGHTYELPPQPSPFDNYYQHGSENARNYLAGNFKFKVLEIEVFKIVVL